MSKPTTLYHPDGREYATSDQVEITRLKAYGYTETAPPTAEDVDFRDLQAQAKERGIPANQSAAALVDAITAHDAGADDGNDDQS